jgi:hypothetical protein
LYHSSPLSFQNLQLSFTTASAAAAAPHHLPRLSYLACIIHTTKLDKIKSTSEESDKALTHHHHYQHHHHHHRHQIINISKWEAHILRLALSPPPSSPKFGIPSKLTLLPKHQPSSSQQQRFILHKSHSTTTTTTTTTTA